MISNEIIQIRRRLDTAIRRITKLEALLAVFEHANTDGLDVVTKIMGSKKTNGKKKA